MKAVGITPEARIRARRLWATVRLLRPLNAGMIMAGVALGGLLSGGVEAL